MLNKFNRGLAVAMLALAVGVPAYTQSINNSSLLGVQQNNALTLSINEISAKEAVKLVCEHFGYTPKFQIPLKEIVSIELSNASFDEAMGEILADSQADYMLENGNLHVFKARESWQKFSDKNEKTSNNEPQQVKQEPTITKIIPLGKRTAEDIQKLVKSLNPGINVVHDIPTNSIVVMGPENQVQAAEILCTSLDRMNIIQDEKSNSNLVNRSRYITQTFELEHADFEEIEKELSTIIERDTSSDSSSSSSNNQKDKDGNPIDTEYFLIDKARRIAVIHTTKEKFAVIEAYFKAIDKPLPQVLIEASIVAVDDGLEKQLGIKWNGLEGTSGYIAPQGNSLTNNSLKDFIKYGGTWDISSVQALLKAVETDNKSQILSRPRVITVTGKTSSIHVGDEIPYNSGTTVTDGGTTTSSVSFKEVGIKLDVTPVVNLNDDTIQLNIIPEVSQWVRDVVMGNNVVPQVSTRRAESTVKIKNGETMVIGGLIESKSVNDVYEVPLLSKIPLVGRVFRSKTTNNTKTNLIILLTAHIVNDKMKATVAPAAVKEINDAKPLRKSEVISELSKPMIKAPGIYGNSIKSDDKDLETKTVQPETLSNKEEKEEITPNSDEQKYLLKRLSDIRRIRNN
jgi:type II secretory pathway component GspD/PulD (secretin)